jgi:hypothetical protein
MGLPWSLGTPVRALLVPAAALLALSGVTASRVEAASTPAGPPGEVPRSVDQLTRTAPAALGPRVLLGTTESARLKQRQPGAQAAATLPLTYHGGQVANAPQVYLSLWGSEWNGAAYQSTVDYLQGFFGGAGGSPWLGLTGQYCSGSIPAPFTGCAGSSFRGVGNPAGQLKGTWVDTHPVGYGTPSFKCGGSSAGDCDVMAAATRAAAHFGPLTAGAVILVFTPSGRSQPGFVASGWCAYHGATTSGVVFGYIPYMPDAGSSCGRNAVSGGGSFDGFSIVGGHEYVEAITDPYPDSGWIDSSGAEDAEKCAWNGLTSISLAGRPYAVQPTWSNSAGACLTG